MQLLSEVGSAAAVAEKVWLEGKLKGLGIVRVNEVARRVRLWISLAKAVINVQVHTKHLG